MDIKKPQLVKVGAFDYFFSGRFCNTPHEDSPQNHLCARKARKEPSGVSFLASLLPAKWSNDSNVPAMTRNCFALWWIYFARLR